MLLVTILVKDFYLIREERERQTVRRRPPLAKDSTRRTASAGLPEYKAEWSTISLVHPLFHAPNQSHSAAQNSR